MEVGGWLLALGAGVAVLVVVLGLWCFWTAGRLDRMHLRVEAARASLLTQLQHRASIATELAIGPLDPASSVLLLEAARAARDGGDAVEPSGEAGRPGHGLRGERDQWLAESDLTAMLLAVELPSAEDEPLVRELADTARKVALARRIHNDVAATTIRLHARRRVRWFHLAGHAAAPQMIDFDDRHDFSRPSDPSCA
jgi:hypothetical protein